MKSKLIIVSLLFFISLSSCQKKEDTYVSKNLPIETVFDKMNSDEKELSENSNQTSNNEEEKKDENQENNEENQNLNSENKTENQVLVTSQDINIRSTPEFSDDNVVQLLASGSEITVLEKNVGNDQQWARIQYQDQVYYISMQFIN